MTNCLAQTQPRLREEQDPELEGQCADAIGRYLSRYPPEHCGRLEKKVTRYGVYFWNAADHASGASLCNCGSGGGHEPAPVQVSTAHWNGPIAYRRGWRREQTGTAQNPAFI